MYKFKTTHHIQINSNYCLSQSPFDRFPLGKPEMPNAGQATSRQKQLEISAKRFLLHFYRSWFRPTFKLLAFTFSVSIQRSTPTFRSRKLSSQLKVVRCWNMQVASMNILYFVCSTLQFISHEMEERDSLYWILIIGQNVWSVFLVLFEQKC